MERQKHILRAYSWNRATQFHTSVFQPLLIINGSLWSMAAEWLRTLHALQKTIPHGRHYGECIRILWEKNVIYVWRRMEEQSINSVIMLPHALHHGWLTCEIVKHQRNSSVRRVGSVGETSSEGIEGERLCSLPRDPRVVAIRVILWSVKTLQPSTIVLRIPQASEYITLPWSYGSKTTWRSTDIKNSFVNQQHVHLPY